jgi:hypothetical protein
VARLDPFFDGEHPTRHIHYRHRPPLASLAPARTVYTGNYVLRRDALDYFIPFAPLKLRMAGPALGRIIRAQLHERFVSANLPMLHRRTLHRTRRSEFRPGIRRQAEAVDLAEELERQYFGDVMLFSVERLAEQGYPDRPAGEERIAEVVETVEADLRRRYTERHVRTLQQFATLRTIYGDPGRWWQQSPSLADTRRDFERFLDNFACNFGEDAPGYRHIACGDHAVRRRREIVQAIAGYPADRNAWRQMLAEEIRTAPETYRPDR